MKNALFYLSRANMVSGLLNIILGTIGQMVLRDNSAVSMLVMGGIQMQWFFFSVLNSRITRIESMRERQ